MNRALRNGPLRRLFETVSRLGDGWVWLALAVVLLLAGPAGRTAGTRLIVTGFASTALYAVLKRGVRRPRPFRVLRDLGHSVAPLDEFSFPSGHTMHAVAFTIVAVGAFPPLAWLLIPFTALVGLSRVVLGLHYPSDVIAGALIGALVAEAVVVSGALA